MLRRRRLGERRMCLRGATLPMMERKSLELGAVAKRMARESL
jgi:hypothetical protein